VKATLFGVPGSHPTAAVQLMLERKGIAHRRFDLLPAISRIALPALGFEGRTAPALRLDGHRLQGSRTISRALDALRPEPRLFPGEPQARAAVEHAEAWGDEVLQHAARRLMWAAVRRDRSTIGTFLESARTGVPTPLAVRTAAPVVALASRITRASDANARMDLERLPGWLDRVDGWIEQGVLGNPEPNAADYQIGASVRLLMCLDDLRPAIANRPAGHHATETVPVFEGRVPRALPPKWLTGLRTED
jgi:glutathione S-transferase